MKVGIAIDEWKLPFFDRNLTAAGIAFKNAGLLSKIGPLILTIETNNPLEVQRIITAAQEEARIAKLNGIC